MDYLEQIGKIFAEFTSLSREEASAVVEIPADGAKGDFAVPCFRIAKEMKKAPNELAAEIAEKIGGHLPTWVSRVEPTGPYVNFFLCRKTFATDVLTDVFTEGSEYGSKGQGEGKKVIVEYSSPNIAKPFHVGHLGSTLIGKALDNIYRFLGYEVTSINHLGDWGTQFGKMIVAYKRWGSKDEIEKTEIDGLVKLYVRFHEEAEKDPTLDEEARAWVVKMEGGDEEGLALWKWFVDISMRTFERIYARLGISFDLYRGESYYSDKMQAVADTLQEKGLLKESQGAKIVELDEYGMPPCLILRSDGGTLYPTRDIAAAIDRYETFSFDKCLYVTGCEQILHFAQWMKVVELMGHEWAKGLIHISYGMTLFEGGKLSTRKGDVIKAENLFDEAVAKTKAIIEEKNPNLSRKDVVAEQVGIGALVFNKLYVSRTKDSVFDWERIINFDGETGPYVQYAHARACNVLKKSLPESSKLDFGQMALGVVSKTTFDGNLLAADDAFNVLRLLEAFPAKVWEAANKNEPFIIARHIMLLAQSYNVFYHNNIILVDDANTRNARLALTAALRQVLKTGLGLLGIQAPVVM